MRFSKVWIGKIAAVVVLLISGMAYAQVGQGSITGEVSDPQGARIPAAKVSLTNVETGVVETTLTDKAGLYNITSINPGKYTLEVTKTTFERSVTEDVVVSTGQATSTNVTMKVGSESASVTVEAQGNDLSATTSNVATTVEHHLVEDLPYPERSALEAVLLVPGVTGDPLQPGGIASENPNYATGFTTPGGSLRVGGGSPGKSVILVDGTDVTQASYPRAGINLSGALVQESTVIVSGVSAQYGRSGGGVILQSSKPGTNEFHGGLDYRHTDPFFNAFPLGTQARSALHQNFYAGYVSGPVYVPKVYNGHDKTFFLVGVEPARLRSGISVLETLLTPAELTGHLKDGLASINTTILKSSGYAAALAAPRINHTYIKYCATTINPAPGTPPVCTAAAPSFPAATGSNPLFPNGPAITTAANYIPIANPTTGELDDVSPQLALNPFAQFVLAHTPSPSAPGPYVHFLSPDGSYNNAGQNATVARGVLNTDNRYSIRIDHQISNSDRVFGRFTSIPVYANRFFGVSPDNPIDSQPSDNALSQNAVLSWTHVFGNNIVNEIHYTYLRDADTRTPPPSGLTEDFGAKLGLTPAATGAGFPGIGSLIVSGYSGLATGLTVSSISATTSVDENYDLADNLQITHGKHLFQIGMDIRHIESNEYNTGYGYGGGYSFAQSATNNGSAGGSPVASLALGLINTFQYSPNITPSYYRWHYYAGYFQDDWRILSTVTLNLGMRWEMETPRMEKFDNQAFFDPKLTTMLNGYGTAGGFCFSNTCGYGRTIFPINYKGFEPRAGIAWAPTHKTTVRASYGLMRVPLTGYEALPDPNLSATTTSVGGTTGGVVANSAVDYLTNPVNAASLTNAYGALNGARGPFYTSGTGITPSYVEQTDTVPYIQQFGLTIQYQPKPKTLIQVGYAGLNGTHLVQPFTPTTGTSVNIPTIAQVRQVIQSQANVNSTAPNQYGVTSNGALVNETPFQKLNPYQGFFNQSIIEAYQRTGKSEYNGLLMSVRQAYGNGLSLLASYVWSKTMANFSDTNSGTSGGSGNATGQDPLDNATDRSVAIYDQPSSFRAGFTDKLPIGIGKLVNTKNKLLDSIAGGISVAGITTWQSGFPQYVTLGGPGYFVDIVQPTTLGATTAPSVTVLPTGYTLRPNIVPGVPLINPKWKQDPFGVAGGGYINPAAFSVPGSLGNPQFGNAPRAITAARSPREFLFDAVVRKQIYFENPRYHLEISGTFSNLFNHPVYFGINTHTAFSTGVLTGAGTTSLQFPLNAGFGPLNPSQSAALSRVIQIGGKLTF